MTERDIEIQRKRNKERERDRRREVHIFYNALFYIQKILHPVKYAYEMQTDKQHGLVCNDFLYIFDEDSSHILVDFEANINSSYFKDSRQYCILDKSLDRIML